MQLTDSEIEGFILPEIKSAIEYSEVQSTRRMLILDRYYGRPLGNEKPGRSKFITKELSESLESVMPHFLKTFASGDPKIDLIMPGKESWVADAFLDEIYKGINKGCGANKSWYILAYEWFKDTFLGDTSHVKAWWEYNDEKIVHEFGDLDDSQMAMVIQAFMNKPNFTMKSQPEEELTAEGNIYKNVKVEETKVIKDMLKVANVPHWEYICFPDGRQVTDDTPKGHKSEVTKDYLVRMNKQYGGIFNGLEELKFPSRDVKEVEGGDNSRATYFEYENLLWDDTESGQEQKRTVPFVEWYTKLDIDGDDFLEDIICWVANGKLIGWELNPTGRTNMASMKAIIDPFKFYGLAFAGFLVEIQNLSTMLWRAILDNFAFANSGRWLVDPLGGIDVERLGKNFPGGVLFGKKDSVTDLTPPPFNPGILNLFTFVDEIRQNRGIPKYTQGMDSESLNKTLGGLEKIQSAAMQKIELMERLMAETGIVQLVRNCALLYQENLRKPFTAIVKGKEVQITPDMIQGEFEVIVNMGTETSVGEKESTNIAQVAEFLMNLNQAYPGLVPPEKAHNIGARFVTAKGFNKQTSEFMATYDEFTQALKQQQQSVQSAQQKQAALEEANAQAQIALFNSQAAENQADPQIALAKLQNELKKIENDKMIKLAQIAQDEKDRLQREKESQRDYAIELIKINQPRGPYEQRNTFN